MSRWNQNQLKKWRKQVKTAKNMAWDKLAEQKHVCVTCTYSLSPALGTLIDLSLTLGMNIIHKVSSLLLARWLIYLNLVMVA